MPGQIVYVVDIDRDELYSPGFVPLRREDTKQEVVYEKGAVIFRSVAPDLDLELTLFVPPNQRADVRLLKVRNTSSVKRRFRIVPYFDLVCAETPGESAGRIEAAFDAKTDTMLFSNPTNGFYRGVGFVATNLKLTHREKIRARFIGAAGRDLAKPFMAATGLSDKHAGDDGRRVFAGTAVIEIDAGSEAEYVLVLGQEETKAAALATAQSLRDPKRAHQALAETRAYWASENAPTIEIESNSPHFDRLVNHWLHYEAVACRLYARGGPNQRSGAFGYRDQLQDVLGVLTNDPDSARRQILLHASQQFLEGDVLKWWHQTRDGRTGLGQRSRASDPHLWLPYVTTRYIAATGDEAILHEKTPYLVGPTVPMDVDSLTYVPRISRITGDLYEHCKLAIDHTLANFGAHGLPLFGTGDWNDGIDHLGFKGKGESVWMGFFLHGILRDFTPIIAAREGDEAAVPYRERAAALRTALDDTWRGDHYIVGYSDAGIALDCYGTMSAAWPALTGAVDSARGLAALEGPLAKIEKADRILLFDRPFDEKTSPFPGRIADYPPGLRENGGQYSHGASWLIDAYVALAEQAEKTGDRRRGAQLRARAFELWRKISPLDKLEGEALAIYGLAPHQQPADISEGLGHAGRGGWSWYTGAAARMLTSAYAILGLRMENGEIIVPDDIFEPKGKLTLRSLKVRGKLYEREPEATAPRARKKG
jgi:cyclic beta-1,2-glucan synthetase